MPRNILLADDELTFRETFTSVLEEEGMTVTAVADGVQALAALDAREFDVAILDIQMPGADGIKVLRELTRRCPHTRVIMISAYGTVEMAVDAIKLGACDYVMKPVMFDDILAKIRQQLQFKDLETENVQLRTELQRQYGIENIIGQSPAMQQVFETVRKIAPTRSNVLIVGESGTGKELVARAIHALSENAGGRFVAINCGAIPENLLESELFGHKKGSFTSAVQDKQGLFKVAEGGTLFLDEIGHMPIACQVKLLRAIEERRIQPVGATETVPFNVKLVAATNRNPLQAIKAGRFREDLYYRLNVVGIRLPPLRERREDIPLLVDHFLQHYNAEIGKNCRGVSPAATDMLLNHSWNGNVRELQNVIERAVIFAEGDFIDVGDLGMLDPGAAPVSTQTDNLQEVIRMSERAHLARVLKKYGGDKAAAAKALGVGLSSLYRKIADLDIDTPSPPRSSEPAARNQKETE